MSDSEPNVRYRVTASPEGPPKEPTLLDRARMAPVTFGLAAVDILVFVLLEASHSTVYATDSVTLLQVGANQRTHVLGGEYYRLASYMFLHIGWLHLLWNIYASVGFCMAVERALGRVRFLSVYLLSGVAGGVASMTFNTVTSAGASGALFGVVGAMLAIRRRQLPSFAAFLKDPPTRSTLVNIAIWVAIGSTVLSMDNAAHLGGLVAGFLFTLAITTRHAHLAWRFAFGAGFAGLVLGALHPWAPLKGQDLDQLTGLSAAYLHGASGFPKNVDRGERFAKKACADGSDLACKLLHSVEAPDDTSPSE